MEETKKNERAEEAKRIVDQINADSELSMIEEMIKDNKITFEHNDKKYRVRMLNTKERDELDGLRRKKFGHLIQDRDILFEKDLIRVYKDRGIDISELDEDIKKIDSEIMDLQLKLGESISKKEDESILKTYSDNIKELIYKRRIIETRKNLYLEFSLENQLLNYTAEVITYLSLDIFTDNEWIRMFNTFDEFQTYSDTELIDKAGLRSMSLQYI